MQYSYINNLMQYSCFNNLMQYSYINNLMQYSYINNVMQYSYINNLMQYSYINNLMYANAAGITYVIRHAISTALPISKQSDIQLTLHYGISMSAPSVLINT